MSDFVEYPGIDGRWRKAYVVSSQPNRSVRGDNSAVTVRVTCPLCPNEHTHGGVRGERGDRGHKIAHCWTRAPKELPGVDNESYVVWDNRPVEEWEK